MIEEAHLIGLPQPSSSLRPLDDAGQPASLDPGLGSMAKRPVRAANTNPEEPSLLAAMNTAAE